jgi:hypothetical protein
MRIFTDTGPMSRYRKWRTFVVENKLRGSHYLASATVQQPLTKLFARHSLLPALLCAKPVG